MLDKLTFSKRRVHTGGLGVLLSAVMLCATPVFAQELRHVAEVLKITSRGPISFGPGSLTCISTTELRSGVFGKTVEIGRGDIIENNHESGKFTPSPKNTNPVSSLG